jgi:hypothetical protein
MTMADTSYLRFTGTIRNDGTFVPGTGWTTTRIRSPLEPNSRYVVDVLDAEGTALESTVATLTVSDDPFAVERLAARVIAYVPFSEESRSVRLRHGDDVVHAAELARRAPVIEQPTVEVNDREVHIRWSAEHDRSLVFHVFVASGSAQTFTIATSLEASEVTIETELLPVEGDCTFAVLATDGLRSNHAVSERVELPFRPPRVTILSPTDGSEVPPDTSVTLLAHGELVSGDTLSERSVTWTIDDQPVGRGQWMLATDALPPGEHVVAVTSDTHHGEVRASVTIRVRERTEDEEEWARIAATIDPDPSGASAV